jgi:hypothetical protein
MINNISFGSMGIKEIFSIVNQIVKIIVLFCTYDEH